MDQFWEVQGEFLEVVWFFVDLFVVGRSSYDESVSYTLVGLADQETFIEVTVEEITSIQLKPSFSVSASFRELTSVDCILDSFNTEAWLLSIFELSFIADDPFSLRFIVVLDASFSMKNTVVPLPFHNS